jgi:2'-hydroxyisoflavone reductase
VDGKQVEDETSPKGLVELEGKTWDAVIDNSGYVPRIVKASADLLAPNVGQYLFISTLSVYADNSRPGLDETDTLATLDDPTSENVQKDYGALKALCEQAAERAMPGRVTVVRPGYIVGPRDTTDRFTYWPIRASRGGEMLVPGKPDDPVQFIDVRDLADFTIRCVENQIFGHFNATGPERELSVSQLMSACIAASNANEKAVDTTFTYAPYDWLATNGWPVGALPILLPSEGDTAGFHRRSVAKAVATGMKYRSAEETCDALIKWWPSEAELREKVAREVNEERKPQELAKPSQPAFDQLRAGISADVESKLLAAWRARNEAM